MFALSTTRMSGPRELVVKVKIIERKGRRYILWVLTAQRIKLKIKVYQASSRNGINVRHRFIAFSTDSSHSTLYLITTAIFCDLKKLKM